MALRASVFTLQLNIDICIILGIKIYGTAEYDAY